MNLLKLFFLGVVLTLLLMLVMLVIPYDERKASENNDVNG